jgi:hypothetical protein
MASQDVEFAFADEDIAELRGVLEQEGVDEIGEADDSEFLPGILVVIAVVALTNVIIKAVAAVEVRHRRRRTDRRAAHAEGLRPAPGNGHRPGKRTAPSTPCMSPVRLP